MAQTFFKPSEPGSLRIFRTFASLFYSSFNYDNISRSRSVQTRLTDKDSNVEKRLAQVSVKTKVSKLLALSQPGGKDFQIDLGRDSADSANH